jgi:hypothetical protein
MFHAGIRRTTGEGFVMALGGRVGVAQLRRNVQVVVRGDFPKAGRTEYGRVAEVDPGQRNGHVAPPGFV